MKYYFLTFIFIFSITKAEWIEIQNRPANNFVSINCSDSINCYFLINDQSTDANEETLIFKSSNKGIDWEEIYRYNPFVDEPKELYSPRCASVPNGKDYFISYFQRGHLKVSNDSAKTFKVIDLETSREVLWIDMYDDKIGMAFTPINNFITYDGWETWEKREDFFILEPLSEKVYFPTSPQFKNKDTICLITLKDIKASYFTIYDMKTNENSYFIIDSAINDKIVYIEDFDFLNESIVVGVGSLTSDIGHTSFNMIYKSTDGGKTWEKKHHQLENINSKVPYAFGLQKVDFYDNSNGIAVGQSGSVALTNDGGETWVYNEIPESMDGSATLKVEWAGRTPIIGTFEGYLYIYEGDYFKFEEEQYKIIGHVTTEEGDPVEGAEIIYRNNLSSNIEIVTITNSEGYYEINDMPVGAYLTIKVKHTLFEKKYSPNVVNYGLHQDTVINFVQTTAKEFYDIAGNVSEDGEGVKKLPISVYTGYGSKDTYTDDEGNYKFEGVPAGGVNVASSKPMNPNFMQFKPDNHSFNLGNDTTGIDFEIVDRNKDFCRRVSGRVTLEGEGVADFEIIAYASFLEPIELVLTDEDGYYITNFFSGVKFEVKPNGNDYEKYSVTPFMYNLSYHEYPDGYVNIDFELSPISSVENSELKPLIYPNPASESITISGIGQGKVEIYNTLGQKLIEKEIFGTSSINTSTLQTGMYVIKLESGGEVVFEKVIVNR